MAKGKPGVMIYFETGRAVKWLDYESKGRLFEAIMEYAEDGVIPAFEGALAMAWAFVVDKIDRDTIKYAETVNKRKRAAYAKWWEEYAKENGLDPNNKLARERWIDMQMDANASDAMQNVQEMPTVTETQSETPSVTETETRAGTGGKNTPAPMAFGIYSNVLLSREEHEALLADLPEANRLIDKLSLHMASSGRTYTSHAATIRKWAMEDEEKRKNTVPSKVRTDLCDGITPEDYKNDIPFPF